jgi:hypothetical protein
MSAIRGTRRTTGSESARQIHASNPSPEGTVAPPAPYPLQVLVDAAATLETRTRSGRVSKPPERYEPVEQVEDDYDVDDYDTEDPDDVSEEIETDSDEEEDESDMDDDGNLDGFIVADKSESSYTDSDDGESPLPKAVKRTPVKKRTSTP